MATIDFEDWIKEAMRGGLTADEVAAEFTAAMNKLNSKEEAEKKKRQAISDYIDSLIDVFTTTHFDKFDTSVAAAVATYVAYKNPATKDWTLDKFKSYNMMVTEMLDESIEVHQVFESMLNGLGAILNPDDRDNFLESMRKGTGRNTTWKPNDKDIIERFLKNL